MTKRPVGWRKDSLRHALAAKGVSTEDWRKGRNTKNFPNGANYFTPFQVVKDNAGPVFYMIAFSKEGMTPEEIAAKLNLEPTKRNVTYVRKNLEWLESSGWATKRGILWDVSKTGTLTKTDRRLVV